MRTYNGWPLLERMPAGWRIDKTAGSPLAGYSFVTNGKSVLNGQKRALLLVREPQEELFDKTVVGSKTEQPTPNDDNDPPPVIDANYVRTVNELARAKFKQKLLDRRMVQT